MSAEILKLYMVLKSISDLCEKATTGNFAHKMATIKHQVYYAQDQLAKIQNQNVQITIDKLVEKLEIQQPHMTYKEVIEMLKKTLQLVIIEEKDPTICACGNQHPLVAEFGKCWEEQSTIYDQQ